MAAGIGQTPALRMRRSSYSKTAADRTASTPTTDDRSARTILVRVPWVASSSAARVTSCGNRLATRMTSYPADAASRARAAPIPEDAPVTRAHGRSVATSEIASSPPASNNHILREYRTSSRSPTFVHWGPPHFVGREGERARADARRHTQTAISRVNWGAGCSTVYSRNFW